MSLNTALKLKDIITAVTGKTVFFFLNNHNFWCIQETQGMGLTMMCRTRKEKQKYLFYFGYYVTDEETLWGA